MYCIKMLTSLSQDISGRGNPVALQASLTVDPLRTVKLLPGCIVEITGGTTERNT